MPAPAVVGGGAADAGDDLAGARLPGGLQQLPEAVGRRPTRDRAARRDQASARWPRQARRRRSVPPRSVRTRRCTGSPSGPSTLRVTDRAVVGADHRLDGPVPPSATGTSTPRRLGNASRTPRAMAAAACGAVSVPLKALGATTTLHWSGPVRGVSLFRPGSLLRGAFRGSAPERRSGLSVPQ